MTVDILTAVFRLWVPLPLLALFSTVTFVHMCGTHRSSNSTEQDTMNKCYRKAKIGCALHACFIGLNLPLAVYSAMAILYRYNYAISTDSLSLFFSISVCLANTFPHLPFWLNFIWNADFRAELGVMFGLRKNRSPSIDSHKRNER